MHRVWRWLEAGFALLALTLLTLACHAMWPDKDGAAAWFQAVGSVGAVAIAIYVPLRQYAALERERRDRELQQSLIVATRLAHLASELLIECSHVEAEANGGDVFVGSYVAALQQIVESARSLEAQDHQNVAIALLFSIRRQAGEMVRAIEQAGRRRVTHEVRLGIEAFHWRRNAEAFENTANQILSYWKGKD